MAVARERLETSLKEAIEHGAQAATIFASTQGDPSLSKRIEALARESGLLLCGPNSMGFHNLDIGLRVTPFPAPKNLVPGGIAAILQSGSVMGALAHNDQRLRFNILVSSGSEYTVSAADYLCWMTDQPSTKVIGLFLETVRDPCRFLQALREAAKRSIPVVMLKVGRTEASRAMAAPHTGAIIGRHEVFEAVAHEHGVHLVDTLDELAATLLIFTQGRAASAGAIASIHDSGGERELLADLAADLDVPLAQLSSFTIARIAPLLEPGLTPENPLDAWGSGKDAEKTFQQALSAMMNDANVAAGLYVLDWRENYYLHEMHERIIIKAAQATSKPLLAVSNYSLTVNSSLAYRLANHGISLLEGTRESLLAVKHLLAQRDTGCRTRPTHTPHPMSTAFQTDMATRKWLDEVFGYQLLSAYGLSTPVHAQVRDCKQAVQAADRIGYPVVLKTAAPGIVHKTEVQGVHLNLEDANAVSGAYEDISHRLGPDVLVCEMAKGGAEWMIGIIKDIDFGPAVMIAPGGIMVELLSKKVVLLAPFTATEAAIELKKLRASKLLTGFRGQPALAFDALCEAVAAVSRIAMDFQECISEMDINPIIISETGATAVDIMIKSTDSTTMD